MGLLTTLLKAPVTGPVWAGRWALERVVAAAEAELHDEDRIVAEIRALAADLEEGRISPDEHAAAEELLLERLVEARAWRAEQGQGTP
jgi:hypothetical protein